MNRFEGLANNKPVPMDKAKPFTEDDFNAGMKVLRERDPRKHEASGVRMCMVLGVISEERGKLIIKRLEDGSHEN